jgi:tetratricopeptide (TPR) repeat protein
MCICIILFLFTVSLLASDEIEPKFGTKPEHLSANITSARDFNFEGWNIAGLGFLDRSELAFEVGNPIKVASESDTMNFQTIYAGYSKPTMKWGVFSIGISDFLNMVKSNNKDSIYSYIGYSKEFLNLFSLGGAYALETELTNDSQNLLNGITQFGLMINIYNYIHLGASIENRGYYDKIDFARVGASIIFPALSRNYAFIGADLNSSFKDIKLFDSATSELENMNVGGGIKLGFFSIKGWLSKDIRYKDSPYKGFIELSLSKSISSDRLHSITLGGRLYESENEYFLTNELTYASGESIAGKKNINKAEKLMSEYNLKDAIKYYQKSKRLLISDDYKNTATQNVQSARKMLNDNESFYKSGIEYYNSQKYDKAIDEFKKIPWWSEFYLDAQSELRISKNEYVSQLYNTITK